MRDVAVLALLALPCSPLAPRPPAETLVAHAACIRTLMRNTFLRSTQQQMAVLTHTARSLFAHNSYTQVALFAARAALSQGDSYCTAIQFPVRTRCTVHALYRPRRQCSPLASLARASQ